MVAVGYEIPADKSKKFDEYINKNKASKTKEDNSMQRQIAENTSAKLIAR